MTRNPVAAPLDPASAVGREFGLYYLADELPHPLADGLPSYYERSARRLRAAVGESGAASLIALLQAMRGNRAHPVVKAIEEDTHFAWSDEPDHWAAFEQLMDGLVAHLR